MGMFRKPRKVVLVLAGCCSGRKAAAMKNLGEGTCPRLPCGRALLPGIDSNPHKVTAARGKRKIAKRSTVKPVVKIHQNKHLRSSRCPVATPLGQNCSRGGLLKRKASVEAKVKAEERYKTDKDKWLFSNCDYTSKKRA
ncbi:large ribosomal subunit protein eL27-like [Tenrec ecaudatus]|uniref:large ribosomal subunit protein eL27-like n=1 Tax=Tenrec ecaudatus TaxID=94439 RepID=UPI003F59319F